ncbi:MAG: DUF433 domain-containing protein [Acidobacteria bacterium]|nr:DUF433 domain-containing protein [Acidobacteriota bacterium]
MENQQIEQRDGVYFVSGTRITLDSIVYAFRDGCSPETIREDFSGLTLGGVFGAISHYLNHQSEIDAYLAGRRQQWTELERQSIPLNADLRARLEKAAEALAINQR